MKKPRKSNSKPIYAPRPIWGFTWKGWVLLAIALALATSMIAGIDLRYHLIHWIGTNLGWRPMFWFVTQFMIGHQFDLNLGLMLGWAGWRAFLGEAPDPGAHLVTLCAALVALQLHPRRHTR